MRVRVENSTGNNNKFQLNLAKLWHKSMAWHICVPCQLQIKNLICEGAQEKKNVGTRIYDDKKKKISSISVFE